MDHSISHQKYTSQLTINQELISILDTISEGVWVTNADGTIKRINRASEQLIGLKREDYVGRNVRDLLKDGSIDRSATLEAIKAKRRVNIQQYVKKTKKHLLITSVPVFDAAGNISMVVSSERDLTELSTLNDKLKKSREVTNKYRQELAEFNLLELRENKIIAKSPSMQMILNTATKLANMGVSNILILGESGTGKGLLSKFIHQKSPRREKPFIQINCAALPESLLEAELFGYEKGAFTGARQQGKPGLFELAHGGTLFLDEIGDLPLPIQAKLLKYLDDSEIMHLGGLKPIKIDCTVIAATNLDLQALTESGKFRRDLFYRLDTFTVEIPPLRDRKEDIFELTCYFFDKYNEKYKVQHKLSPEIYEKLMAHPFEGNVRELKNILKRAVVLGEDNNIDELIHRSISVSSSHMALTKKNCPQGEKTAPSIIQGMSLEDQLNTLEREILQDAKRRFKSTRKMAKFLSTSQSSIMRKLKKYGMQV